MNTEKEEAKSAVVFHLKMFNNQTGCISIDGKEELYMENRLKEFFSVLLNHKNKVLTREELMSFVWKDIIVSEESLSKAISDLRKFIQLNGFTNLKIITVSKVGYKLEFNEDLIPEKNHSHRLKKVYRFLWYLILSLILFILIIRAMRYEQ